MPEATSSGTTQFPRGSVVLHACRLFPTKKLCTSEHIVRAAPPPSPSPLNHPTTEPPANPIAAAAATLQSTKYIDKIEGVSAAGLTPTNVGTYSVTNTAFTDVFAAHYDEGRASIAPKSSNCKQAPHRTMHRTCTAQSQALRPLRNPRLPTRGGPIPSTRGVRLVEHPSFVSLARSTSCTPRRSTTTGSRAACSASASTRRPPPAHRAHPHFSRACLAVTSPPPSDPAGAQLRCDLNDEVQSLPHV